MRISPVAKLVEVRLYNLAARGEMSAADSDRFEFSLNEIIEEVNDEECLKR